MNELNLGIRSSQFADQFQKIGAPLPDKLMQEGVEDRLLYQLGRLMLPFDVTRFGTGGITGGGFDVQGEGAFNKTFFLNSGPNPRFLQASKH